MSATTTDPRIDTAPGPGVVHTPQEIDDEIMKEWDGVEHFFTGELPSGCTKITVNCGAETLDADEFMDSPGDEIRANDCPLCLAIHLEICEREGWAP